MTNASDPLRMIAQRALEFVPEGSTIGLGTGRAATMFLHALGERVKAGFQVRGVPTSDASARLARSLGIPLTTLDECPTLEVDIDGADEVDPEFNVIKGYGGALVREKIVATASRRMIILVGEEKIVDRLGERGRLPVEVIPFAVTPCQKAMRGLGLVPQVRLADDGKPLITDNGNYILDCGIAPLDAPGDLEMALRAIPGVVGTGLFLGMEPTILIGYSDRVDVREPD